VWRCWCHIRHPIGSTAATVDAVDGGGNTPLLTAAAFPPRPALTTALLAAGADPTRTDHDGDTPAPIMASLLEDEDEDEEEVTGEDNDGDEEAALERQQRRERRAAISDCVARLRARRAAGALTDAALPGLGVRGERRPLVATTRSG
jgi:hypothetical protein